MAENFTIKLKRGLAEAWERVNPVLKQGEPGFTIDTNRLKLGDGKTAWNDLPYVGTQSYIAKDSYYSFPSVGEDNLFYIDLTNYNIYIWHNNTYKRVSTDSESIVIDTELSETSNNPIANSVVTKAIKEVTYTFGEGFEVDEETNTVTATAVANEDEIIYATKLEDLPAQGKEDVVYKVGKTLYFWDSSSATYEAAGGMNNITIIDGGNSNG